MQLVFWGILAYILLSLMIGLWISQCVHTETDYLVAGRSLGYVLATFSIFATWFGAETCIGAAGAIYERGLSGVRADPFGYTLCLVLMAMVYAVPLWNRRLTTMADLLRERYSPGVERLAALIVIPSSILWAAAQIRAFGHMLSASSEFQLDTCIAVAAGIVVVYTVTGGLLADAWTDVVQGSALMVGLLVLAAVLATSGAPLPDAQLLAQVERPRTPWLERIDAWAVPIFGSVVAQELISRVIAARSATVARRATFMAAGLYLAVGCIPLYVGLVGMAAFPSLGAPEQIMPRVAQQYLTPLLYVIYTGALVSAILSTVDSALLSASGLLSHNVIVSWVPRLTDRTRLRLARIGVVVLGLVAYTLAIYGTRTYEMVETASALGSSGILVVLTFGLFTRWGGAASASVALLAGILTWLAGTFPVEIPGRFLLSVLAAACSYVAVSMLESIWTRCMRPATE